MVQPCKFVKLYYFVLLTWSSLFILLCVDMSRNKHVESKQAGSPPPTPNPSNGLMIKEGYTFDKVFKRKGIEENRSKQLIIDEEISEHR